MAAISMFYGLVIYLYQFDNIRHPPYNGQTLSLKPWDVFFVEE